MICRKCGQPITPDSHRFGDEGSWEHMAGECPTTGFQITSIQAFVAVDPADGDEGIMAFQSAGTWVPMIAADVVRLTQLRALAESMAIEMGIEVRLVRFDRRTTIEIINQQVAESE